MPSPMISQIDPVPSSRDGSFFSLDLNLAALDFPRMGLYQEILRSTSVEDRSSGGRGAHGARGGRGSRGGSGRCEGTGPIAGRGKRGGCCDVGGIATCSGCRGSCGGIARRGGRARAVLLATYGKIPVSGDRGSNGLIPF